MFSQVQSISKLSLFLIYFFIAFSCAPGISNAINSTTKNERIPSLLLIPGQLSAPQSIRSIQLYKKGFINNPPIIELGTNNKLVLEFDELAAISGQFRIQFSHHNRNWDESGLPDPWIFEGINELFLRGGERNQEFKPDYFHYKLEFPNRDLKFNVSGHYLIHVFDYQSGIELFSIPFFVTENKGELATKVETVFNQGTNGSAIDQLFGEFVYPNFVEFPQFDLSYSFVQNRFWKNVKKADQTRFTTKGKTEFHLSRENSFPANFDFSLLDLSELSLQNPQIYNFEPSNIPPTITLKDDVLNFLSDSRFFSKSELGFPSNELSARYTEVLFRFNLGGRASELEPVFLIGDFNQWSISDRYKMKVNPELGILETKALIKEGKYSYKYVMLENAQIKDFRLSDSITKKDQEYIWFVYYRDPQYQYDRLLKTKLINSFY